MELSIAEAWSIERNHPKNLEFPDKYPIKGFFVKNSNEGRREISAEQNSKAFLAKPMFFLWHTCQVRKLPDRFLSRS